MIVVSILPQVGFGPNDHRDYASHFSFGCIWPVKTSNDHLSRTKETVYSSSTIYIGTIPSRRAISIPVLVLNWTKSRTNSNFRWKSERPQTRTIMRRFSGFGIKNSIRGETEPCEDGPPPRLSNQDFLESRDCHSTRSKYHWTWDFSCKAKRSGWRSKTRQGESPKQYRFWLVSRRAHLYFSRGVWVSKVDGHPSSSNVPQWNLAKPKNTLYWFLYWLLI